MANIRSSLIVWAAADSRASRRGGRSAFGSRHARFRDNWEGIMALNKRTKLGVTVAVAVLAGLTSGLAGMLVLVVAWLLIVWGQAPERTESFVGGFARRQLPPQGTGPHRPDFLAAGFEANGFGVRGARGVDTRGAGSRRYGKGRRNELGSR